MVKIESKEKLAKLLAMEDLDVQHRQVPTAYFDVKGRTLILPTWQDMSNELYDLLVGHEVGHALYTPSSEKQLKTLIEKTSKHCVNIVEDARIEALIKRRYPGLRKQMFAGYSELIQKDFFGIDSIDPNTMKLLDRINLHFKIPTYARVDFTDEENVFVDRIEKAKTFKDVSKICIDLAEYIKENPEETEESETDMHEDYGYDDNDDFDSEGELEDGESKQDDSSNGSESDSKNEEGNDDSESSSNDGSKDSTEETENDEGEDLDTKQQGDPSTSNEAPDTGNSQPTSPTAEDNLDDGLKSKTYENFEHNVEKLAETKTKNHYLNIPEKINYDNVVDYKMVHSTIKNFYRKDDFNRYNDTYCTFDDFQWKEFYTQIYSDAKTTLAKIKRESMKNVNHMVMDFERKKCADIYKRTLLSKTGVLDTNKLFSAKYNEDVFRKNVKAPEGKSHGLVLFIDWSGSMSGSLSGCIKQLIELVFFCKKVNIPFEVYSFTDVHSRDGKQYNSFKLQQDDFAIDTDVRLRNYMSSRMNLKEFNEGLVNLCIISNAYTRGGRGYSIPLEDRLGYTPLAGAILFSEHLIRDFKRLTNVQEVHSVWITDGEGNQSFGKWDVKENAKKKVTDDRYSQTERVYLQDKITKKNHLVEYGRITEMCFEIVKDRLGINVVGFFIDSNFNNKWNMEQQWSKVKPVMTGATWEESRKAFQVFMKKTKKIGYIISTQRGYDEYYVISNVIKEVKPVEFTDKMTARKMATIFSNKSNQFKNTRVLLSRFIDLITVNS